MITPANVIGPAAQGVDPGEFADLVQYNDGFRTGLTEAIREFCEFRDLLPRGVKLTPEDIWARCSSILSVRMSNPQFTGQTKDRLSSREASAFVHGVTQDAIYGTVGETLLSHEDFDPVWREAERLGLPVCVHTGWCHPGLKRPFTDSYGAHVLGFTLPVMMGFYAFAGGGILDRFPRLKVAFLEAGVDWVPYVIERMDHYFHSESANRRVLPRRRASDYVRDCEIYFTCEAEEKLVPQVMEFVGEDRIMISADMPHGEAREGSVQEIRERTDLSDAVKQRILGDNAAKFYSI